MEKLNFFRRLLLKAKDNGAYKDYKFLYALQFVTPPDLDIVLQNDVHFKHSGNAGDIIYALPAIMTLARDKRAHLHLQVNQKLMNKLKHPLGDIMLDEKMVSMLQPLLLNQPYLDSCDIYNQQKIDFNLDKFREYPFDYKKGNIARWYFLVFAVSADLSLAWLRAMPDKSFNNAIVLARSQRYRAPAISYNFLSRYPRIVFVGVEEEYKEMRTMIPSLEYNPVTNFMELANIIAGSKLFIGNQSFPFAIAEALKIKRLLEVYHLAPNVIVEGSNGYDFCYQPQFEKLVNEVYESI